MKTKNRFFSTLPVWLFAATTMTWVAPASGLPPASVSLNVSCEALTFGALLPIADCASTAIGPSPTPLTASDSVSVSSPALSPFAAGNASASYAASANYGVLGIRFAAAALSETHPTNGSAPGTIYQSPQSGAFSFANVQFVDYVLVESGVLPAGTPVTIGFSVPVTGALDISTGPANNINAPIVNGILNVSFSFAGPGYSIGNCWGINSAPGSGCSTDPAVRTGTFTANVGDFFSVVVTLDGRTTIQAVAPYPTEFANAFASSGEVVGDFSDTVLTFLSALDSTVSLVSSSGHDYSQIQPPQSGPIGHWKADGNPSDSSPTANNGIYSGPYALGIAGQAFDFSSLDRNTGVGAVSIPDDAAYSFGSDFSVAFWFNVNGSPNPQVFLGQDDGNGEFEKWFIDYGYLNSGAFEIHINGPSGAIFLRSDPIALPSGWNQFTLTKSGSTFSFYLNGAAIGSQTYDGTFPNPTNHLTLGWAEPGLGYNGLLDEVVIYNRALPSAEVQALAAGQIGHWKADENASDASPTANNGVYPGPYAPGIAGQAFDFSSLDRNTGVGAVSIPDNAAYSFGPDLSVGFWFNINGSANPQVFLGQDNGNGEQEKWFIDYGYANPGAFEIHLNGPSHAFLPSDPITLPSGWNQLTVTKSGSTYSFYLNGRAIGIQNFDGTFPEPTNNITLGWAEPGLGYNGLLDEVLIYDRALSLAEVRVLANFVPDTTPPQVSCGAADGGWHNSDVTIACTASDPESGLANTVDASFNLTTSVPIGTETANASTNSRQVCNNDGGCRTAGPIGGNKVDKKPPTITISSPAANATYQLNASVGASYACVDGGSGIASCQGTVPNAGRIDTSSAGTKTFTVTSTDSVGNPSSLTVTYSVESGGGGGLTSADVGITLSAPAKVSPGGTLTYAMTVTNAGKVTATSVVVSDVLPAGTIFTSASASQGVVTAPAVGSNGTVIVNLGSLQKGATATISIVVAVTAASGTILANTAMVTATTQDVNSGNNSATQNTTVSKK